jgi:hypothetical protein
MNGKFVLCLPFEIQISLALAITVLDNVQFGGRLQVASLFGRFLSFCPRHLVLAWIALSKYLVLPAGLGAYCRLNINAKQLALV